MKELYNTTKTLTARYQVTDKPIKDKQGKTLTLTEEQLKRWVDHFSDFLNRPGTEDPPDIPPSETELSINCAKPSRQEIRKAIQALKNGKAAGTDSVGSPRKSGQKPSCASSILMLNWFSFMGHRRGDAQKRHYRRSKRS